MKNRIRVNETPYCAMHVWFALIQNCGKWCYRNVAIQTTPDNQACSIRQIVILIMQNYFLLLLIIIIMIDKWYYWKLNENVFWFDRDATEGKRNSQNVMGKLIICVQYR